MNMKRFVLAAVFGAMTAFPPADMGFSAERQGAFPRIELPPVSKEVLKNGVRLIYVRDELPQVYLSASVDFGSLHEKKQTAGLSELTAKTLSLSGSAKYPGSSLYRKVESMGGRLSVASSWESTVISIRVLKRFKNEAFDILADLVANPAFTREHFERAKELTSESIRRKYDNPAGIAFEKAREILFDGDGYGSAPTEEKIKGYTLDDIKAAWKRYYTAGNIIVGVTTSIDYDEVRELADKGFSGWRRGEKTGYSINSKHLIEALTGKSGNIYLFEKDVPQATIVMGTLAPPVQYSGNYALDVMNYVLGGGSFNSWLMSEVRVKRGLAYSVQSVLRARQKTGVFLAFAQTKNKSVNEVLGIMKASARKMSDKGVSGNELAWARRSIDNSYVFRFDTPRNILNNYMNIEYYGLPVGYYRDYLKHINMVTAADIRRESGKLFNQGMVTVVVGKSELAESLKDFGRVVVMNSKGPVKK